MSPSDCSRFVRVGDPDSVLPALEAIAAEAARTGEDLSCALVLQTTIDSALGFPSGRIVLREELTVLLVANIPAAR